MNEAEKPKQTKLIAVWEDGDETPVKVAHWWPGRVFKKDSPISQDVIDRAIRTGAVYATVASVDVYFGVTFCSPKDTPDRSRGRKIAVGRLAKVLDLGNVRIVEVPAQ